MNIETKFHMFASILGIDMPNLIGTRRKAYPIKSAPRGPQPTENKVQARRLKQEEALRKKLSGTERRWENGEWVNHKLHKENV